MYRIIRASLAIFIGILGLGVASIAEEITLTTYYPAPYGAYEELSADNVTTTNLTTTDNTYLALDSGQVIIGTTNPLREHKLYVKGHLLIETLWYPASRASLATLGQEVGLFMTDRDGNYDVQILTSSSYDSYINNGRGLALGATSASGYRLYVQGAAYSTGGWTGSDMRWKQNIETLSNSLDKILKLRGVRYDWKTEELKNMGFPAGKQIGIIAQELEKEFPELVNTNMEGYKAIAYDRLTAVLLEAIKSQQEMIETQQGRIEKLEKEIQGLKKK